jgi:hypothetical protein
MYMRSLSIIFIIALLLLVPACTAIAAQANISQAELGDISGAWVTLYYYNASTGVKGDIVPIADNPQQVSSDPSVSPMGAYTFTRVPAGTYYVEAVNNGNAYFAIVTVSHGTETANVAIPTWKKVDTTPSATAIVSPTPVPTIAPTPLPTSLPASTPAPRAMSSLNVPLVALTMLVAAVFCFMAKARKH